METKGTKDRLDELRELYKGGYVTESEFKIARLNILNDGGIDVLTQLRQHARQTIAMEENEEPKGSGCGCFLAALLAVFLVSGVSFFAAPHWPDRFGGTGARIAREWFTAKATDFMDGFFGNPAETQAPDPISSEAVQPAMDSADITGTAFGSAEAEQQNEVRESVAVTQPPAAPSVNQAALPSIDMHILSLPFAPAGIDVPTEPDITVAEIQTSASAESDTIFPVFPADPGAENILRGYVTAQIARIRSAPDISTNDNVVARGQPGDRFTVLEEGLGSDGSKWYRIQYENGSKRGWIRGSLVKLEK